jgi:hypothetical protein
MNTKSLLAIGLCVGILVTTIDASARGYRRPAAPKKPATQKTTPKPPVPKTLTVSGMLYSLSVPGKSLVMQDERTNATVNLVITSETKFAKDGQPVPATDIKAYSHITVTYQDTDSTVKTVTVTPKTGTTANPPPKDRKKTRSKN